MENQKVNNKGQIVLYQPDSSVKLDVLLEDETVWLSKVQMAELFQTSRQNVGKHINNVFTEGELEPWATIKEKFIVQLEGGREVSRNVEYYNLDLVISVGYRVKSKRGTQFRQWANVLIKEYILKGYAVNERFERIEGRLAETEKKIDFFVRTSLPPVQGVFFEGQIFDAYAFVSDLIKSAKNSIVLIDNYVDETVLVLLSKRMPNTTAEIYTKNISSQLKLDLEKHNSQYEPVSIHETNSYHDRFLIIDHVVYHIGASLKDLGKKLFAFSRMDIEDRKITDDL